MVFVIIKMVTTDELINETADYAISQAMDPITSALTKLAIKLAVTLVTGLIAYFGVRLHISISVIFGFIAGISAILSLMDIMHLAEMFFTWLAESV